MSKYDSQKCPVPWGIQAHGSWDASQTERDLFIRFCRTHVVTVWPTHRDRHSHCTSVRTGHTRLWAWSTSSPLIFLHNARCSTHTYRSRRQKFCCRRTACGTVYRLLQDRSPATDSLGNIWKHIHSGPRNRGALWLFIVVRYTNTFTYLHFMLRTATRPKIAPALLQNSVITLNCSHRQNTYRQNTQFLLLATTVHRSTNNYEDKYFLNCI